LCKCIEGECKESSFKPHYWPCANPKVSICNLDQAFTCVLQFLKNHAELCKHYLADTKNSSRSSSIGSSFGMWVARTIFSQPVHLFVKVVDPLSIVYTDVSYNLIFASLLTKWYELLFEWWKTSSMIWYQASFTEGECIFSHTLCGLSNNSTAIQYPFLMMGNSKL
jgi:hypothetical protein